MRNIRKFLAKFDIVSVIVGGFLGMFIALAIFSALVPSGLDMIKLYYPERAGLNRVSTSTKDFEISR